MDDERELISQRRREWEQEKEMENHRIGKSGKEREVAGAR